MLPRRASPFGLFRENSTPGIFKQALPPAKTRACTDRLAARSLATLQQVGGKTALLFRDLQGGASPGYWPMPNDFPCSTGRLPGPVFNREKLDFRIILVVPELRFVTPRLNGFVPPGFGGAFRVSGANLHWC